MALRQMGPGAKVAIPALAESMRDGDKYVGIAAAQTLERLGPEAVPSLARLLRNPEPHVQMHAAESLGRIGPEATAAIPALTATLRDPDASVREAAILALQQMGPGAKAAIPALAESVRDQDRYVGIAAAQTLERMGPDAVPSLARLLRYPEPHVQTHAAESLGRIGPEATAAVPALTATLQDPDPSVREAATLALRHIGPAASAAIPRLQPASRQRPVRWYGCRAHIGPLGAGGGAQLDTPAAGSGNVYANTRGTRSAADRVGDRYRRLGQRPVRIGAKITVAFRSAKAAPLSRSERRLYNTMLKRNLHRLSNFLAGVLCARSCGARPSPTLGCNSS